MIPPIKVDKILDEEREDDAKILAADALVDDNTGAVITDDNTGTILRSSN